MKRLLSLILLLVLSNPVAARLSVGDAGPLRLGKDVRSGEEVLLPDSAGKITVVHCVTGRNRSKNHYNPYNK